jgi:zinc/manganese transport system ATP-binding protein
MTRLAETLPSPAAAATVDRSVPIVAMREGAVQVSGRTIWSGVDVDVEPGQFVAILGPNGVGKSTLIKTVLGQIPLASARPEARSRQPRDRLSPPAPRF